MGTPARRISSEKYDSIGKILYSRLCKHKIHAWLAHTAKQESAALDLSSDLHDMAVNF